MRCFVIIEYRWLIAQGLREEAIIILRKTHHPSEEETVMLTVSEIEAQIGMTHAVLMYVTFHK
jgi:hypothetical protein